MKREMAQFKFLHITLPQPCVYLSVLHLAWRPARSWVQRAEVLGGSLVLFYEEKPFLMECIPSFVVFWFVWNLFHPR